ncbi:MAG: GLUG motif-containing protein [Sedimentisphaeraceae bacterium JB056]
MKNFINCAVLLMVCGFAFGFSGGTGTTEDPYQISTEADLLQVNNDITASYILVNDIILTGQYSDSLISAGQEGGTISTFTGAAFRGTFDGNGFTVKNLDITAGTSDNVGLFGYVYQGTVKDLGIEEFAVSGHDSVGVLAGRNEGTIDGCYVSGDPNSVQGNMFVGGLIGITHPDSLTVNCWANAQVEGAERVGGLVGQNGGDVTDCYAMGNAHATTANTGCHCGGLIGWYNTGEVSGCYATGNVSGEGQRIGGLAGNLVSGAGPMTNCYATGNVSHTGGMISIVAVGGLVGQSAVDISECYATGNVDGAGGTRVGGFGGFVSGAVSNCYATGEVTASNTVGGFAGLTYDGVFTACYSVGAVNGSSPTGGFVGQRYQGGPLNGFWDTETSGTTTGIGTGGTGGGVVTGKTTTEMKTKQTFTDAGWDFDTIWVMPADAYPVFDWQLGLHPADLTRNGIVDQDDLAIFVGEWLSEAL